MTTHEYTSIPQPTTEQLKDPNYWATNAPDWADRIVMDPEHGLAYFASDRYRLRVYDNGRDQPVFDTHNKQWKDHVKEKWVVLAHRPEKYTPKAPPIPDPPEPVSFETEFVDPAKRPLSRPEMDETRHPSYRPDPGTETLATWLEPPDGGDRTPEIVIVKAYYHDKDDREQVWFSTETGHELVHLVAHIEFQKVDVAAYRELVDIISTHDASTAALTTLERFDLTRKE